MNAYRFKRPTAAPHIDLETETLKTVKRKPENTETPKRKRLSADQFEDWVPRRSGLLDVSETDSDVRDLSARQTTDPRAAEAVELFCFQARKWIGTLAASLGRIDALVFSGGIGENSPEIRDRLCDGLAFLGVLIDPDANAWIAPLISTTAGTVAVRVIPTDEELMIAKTVFRAAVTDASATEGEFR